MNALVDVVDGLPNLSGSEKLIEGAAHAHRDWSALLGESPLDGSRLRSAAAIALHMHQPLIPAGGAELRTARIISNLQYMMEHPSIGDNHNAPLFQWCYTRMGEFIPQLIHEGKQPRIMLDYSGCLLHGLRNMGLHDVIESLQRITCDPGYRRAVEWLATPWGGSVASSRRRPTPRSRPSGKRWASPAAG